MPLYEYECQQCHRRVEKIQSFSAEPLRVCESCGGPLEKLISAPAIQFKGSGWYVTDYKKSGASAPNASPAAKDSKPAGETTTPSETKNESGKDSASKAAAPAKPAASTTPAE